MAGAERWSAQGRYYANIVFQIAGCIIVAVGIIFAQINVREMNQAQKELVLICTLMTIVLLAPNAGGSSKFRMRTHAEPAMVILAAIGLRRAFAGSRFAPAGSVEG